jgi:hypothetical protein
MFDSITDPWGRISSAYDEFTSPNLYKYGLDLFEALAAFRSDRILDIGCGTGFRA